MRPALDHDRMLPIGSEMATIVLLNVAAMAAMPCGMFFRSLRLLPARRAPAFGALAVAIFLCSSCLVRGCRNYFFVAFFLPATAPLRGPLRVRAFVWVRWPRTGSPRRWRMPRQLPRSIRRLMFIDTSRGRSPSTAYLAICERIELTSASVRSFTLVLGSTPAATQAMPARERPTP